MKSRSPAEVVDLYLDTLYSQHRLDLVRELIAPETWRHTPGGSVMLTLDESIERIGSFLEKFPVIRFEHAASVVEGEMVTSIWNGWLRTQDGKDLEIGGIEVFRVVKGQIVEVWNQEPAASRGLWQESRLSSPG